MSVLSAGDRFRVECADALEFLRGLPDSSIDCIITDPPYFRVKNLWWDKQWEDKDRFIAWIGDLSDEWLRVLKPNGSLYCFASPRMSAAVEVEIGRRFNVLNAIRWNKTAGWHKKARPDCLRSFLSPYESIIFAEHFNSDNIALGESGYDKKCDELRGFVFEPLRAYLAGEWSRAGLSPKQANEATGTQMAGHYFTRVQWALPTKQNYQKLRSYANAKGGEYLRTEYEELRTEYEELRTEYEELRRFFSATPGECEDTWEIRPVAAYPEKHPCEKPQELISRLLRASTRENAVVLDCFCGGGSTAEASIAMGRRFIGCDIDEKWAKATEARAKDFMLKPIQIDLASACG